MKFREGFKKIRESKSRTFFVFCFCFLSGIAYASIHEKSISSWYLLSVGAVLICGAIVWRSSRATRFTLCSLLCIIFGIYRYQSAFPTNDSRNIHFYTGNTVSVTGFVSSEPDVRIDGVRYRVRVTGLVSSDDEVRGEIYVKTGLHPRYVYGEELHISCQIEEPEPIEDEETGASFRYDRYLSRMNIYALCTNPKITSTERNRGNYFFRAIFSFKSVLGDHIAQIWHEPYASFVAGLLYGYRGGLGSLNELFATTGVTHIVAISGYNITIIATIFIGLCKAAYIPRKKAFYVVVVGIIVFVIFAGASASVIRAGVMGVIVLIAQQSGRMSSIANVLALTAVLMSLHNPFVLIWDAGFQLSFLATLGLVYLSPEITRWFKKIPQIFGLKESLISTISAIIVTLPIILFQFGRLSIVAPVVNILILWLIPWIMIAGTLAVIVSFFSFSIGGAVGIVAYAGMEYSIQVVSFFAGVPHASIQLRVSWTSMLIMYIMMIVYLYTTQKKISI